MEQLQQDYPNNANYLQVKCLVLCCARNDETYRNLRAAGQMQNEFEHEVVTVHSRTVYFPRNELTDLSVLPSRPRHRSWLI